MREEVYYNVCPAAGCHQNCVVKLWVRDGKIYKVESADYPDDPEERCICLRGLASLRMVYHPDRLKYPMRRVGERGSGKWQRITWDEAFDSIAGKLLEIKEKYGPEAVKVSFGGSSSEGILLSGRLLGPRFANLWGTGGYLEGLGWIDDGATAAASLLTLGVSEQDHTARDFLNSKMVILWGFNPAVTNYREMKSVLDARDKGVRLVVIGPVFNATAAKADWWIPIKPGTDSALALSMMNVIVNENCCDNEYIAKYSVGPFLVRDDNKNFLRSADNKYMVWDKERNSAQSYDIAFDPALLGDFTINGVRCKPSFQLLVERISQYPPKKVAEITGIPAEIIKKLALEYASSKPAAIRVGFGMSRTYHGCLNYRSIISLAAITGNIGIRGGGASMEKVLSPISLNYEKVASPGKLRDEKHPPRNQGNGERATAIKGMNNIPGAQNAIRAWAAIKDGKPNPIKVFIRSYKNPLVCSGHLDGWREIFKQMELIVVSEIFLTRTAQWADIVLPEAVTYERDDIGIKRNYLVRLEKAVEPVGEAKSPLEIWSELARRVGLGQYFQYDAEDYIKMLLETDHPSVAGITPERLEKEKIIRANFPLTPSVPFDDKVFPTPSGRIEFYQERLVEFGEELPVHKESLESPRRSALHKKYPLIFFTVKWHTTTHSQLANVEWMRELAPEALLHINSIDAGKRGIKDDDVVMVFNDRGRVKLKARINEAFPPGVVNIYHGWWPEHFLEGHYNDLLHRIDDVNIISPSLEIEPIISNSEASAALIQYDCLVEVRKV